MFSQLFSHVRVHLLTSIYDFAKEIFATQEIACRAVPATIAELMLALGNGHVGTLDQGTQHTRIVPHQTTLLAAQCGMNRWIHVHYPSADGGNVVRFANLGDAPVEGSKESWAC